MKGVAIVALVAVFTLASSAQGAETAREILDRRKSLEDTSRRWNDRYQEMKLVISGGTATRERKLKSYEQRKSDDQTKSLVIFEAPAELRGTGLLADARKGEPAEQWLYVPAMKKVRRITADTRDQSFAGTDLTYRDLDLLSAMTNWTEDDAASSLQGEETIDGVPCHVVELVPKRADIGYGRIVIWLGKEDLVPRQVNLFEAAPSRGWIASMTGGGAEAGTPPTRRIQQSEVSLVGQVPVARKMVVESPAKGTRTEISVDATEFDRGLDDGLFTTRSLERGGE